MVLTTDDVTIAGVRGATIDGSGAPSEAVILIDGARGFVVQDLTVENGADQGILVTRQAQGVLRGLVSTRNGTVGTSGRSLSSGDRKPVVDRQR